jgi:spermidine dehydrogenase
MDRAITRRDFLDGVALAVGGLALAGTASGLLAACESGKPTLQTPHLTGYPPDLTGLQGETDAARAVPHMLRDGKFWGAAGSPRATGESYDLAVVGGGISGLAAAYLYSRRNPGARILVLDNHDDFGGHARRNELTPVVGGYGRLLIGFGGTESVDSPDTFKPEVLAVLKEIGVELKRFYRYYDRTFYERLGLVTRLKFYDKETWGRDQVVVHNSGTPLAEQLKDAPLADQAKRDLVMITDHPKDWLPGLSDTQKKERLTKITYAQYLTDTVHVHPDVVKYLQTLTSAEWGYGIDGVGAIDAWADGYPGFDGLKLDDSNPYKYNAPTEHQFWNSRVPYIFHFPEGGAGVARLLVRALIPEALPGHTMEDEVLARLEYEQLDRPENRVRIRLGSPVVRVKNVGDPASATEVEVAYVQGGELKTVKAKGAVVACWYSMVPYIVDGLPAEQKKAALFMTRIPLLYATVLIRNWRVFQKLRIQSLRTVGPGAFWLNAFLDYPVSMGGYEHPSNPDGPILVHMTSTPCKPGMPPREGVRVGRQELYQMPFSDIERRIRDLLARSLGSAGFDPANDIQAITVNRWAHGYSFEYGLPWDSKFYPGGPLPGEAAARPFGRITFANTDRSSRAYIDSAIDAASSAVNDLLGQT